MYIHTYGVCPDMLLMPAAPIEKGRVTTPLLRCTTRYQSSPHSVRPVPALSHRQQWANSEPIMSDHCHIPEPTHADRARPRSEKERERKGGGKGRTEGGRILREGGGDGGGGTSLQVIAQITIRKRDPSYSAIQKINPRPSSRFAV